MQGVLDSSTTGRVAVTDSKHTVTTHREEPPANKAVTVSIHIVTTHKEEPPANKYIVYPRYTSTNA